MNNVTVPELALSPRINSQVRFRSIEVLILLLGVISPFYIQLVGQLYLSEILLLLLFPFLWMRYWRGLLNDRLTGRILLFGSLWFINQAFTDWIRGTSTNDFLRGWAGILVLLATFSSLYILIKKSVWRIQIFLFGYVIGSLASLYLQPHPSFLKDPWKFGLSYPTTLFILLFISYTSSGNLRKMNKWVLPLLALGGLSVYFGARSFGATIILTAIVLWIRNRNFGRAILTRINIQNILAGGLIVGIAIWSLSSLYGIAAQKGYLGRNAQWKYAWQSSGQFGLLLGGRSEILASMRAIGDSPLIGHGSWAKNPAYRVFLYRLIDFGYGLTQEEMDRYIEESDLIPAHSHIFQAWVWAGIMGAVFWVVIIGMIARIFIQSNGYPNSLYILVVFVSIISIWDIFFSPFGSLMRLHWCFQWIILISAYYQSLQIAQANQAI